MTAGTETDPTARSEAFAEEATVTLVGLAETFKNWPAPDESRSMAAKAPVALGYVRIE